MNMENQKCASCGACSCPHHKMVPFLVVLFAILFLGEALGWFTGRAVAVGWPIIVLIAGLTKLFGGMCKCCDRR